jgi:hypothetical protein
MIPHALTAAAILAQCRAATLSRPLSSIGSIQTRGTIEAVGLKGVADEWDDVRSRSFVQRIVGAEAIAGTQGWNGRIAWYQETSGITRVDGGESTRLQDIDQAYTDTYAYLQPKAGGAKVLLVGQERDGESVDDVLRVTPSGGSPLDLWIDRRTHLVDRVSTRVGAVSSTTTYSNYRVVHAIAIPFQQITTVSTGNNSTETVTAVQINQPLAANFASVPPSRAHDYSIAGGASTTIPITVVNNHIYLHVMLDGKGPYTFVFDTGGTYILTPEVAAALHATATGTAQVQGVGAASQAVQFAHVKQLQIGDATIANQDFLVLPIGQSFGVAEGFPIDGMIGYDIPARFLTTVDYAARTMTLAMPASVTPRGSAVPFYFDGTIPKVEVNVNGIDVEADLDTGNRAAFDLYSPFVAAHPKIAQAETTGVGVLGFGVGGPLYGRLGRVNLRIGAFSLDNVVTGFSTQTTGATADPFTPANVGGGLWNRFTLTLDYPGQRIFLQPNAAYGRAFSYDRSGLFLIDYGGNTMVLDARPETPAAEAGMKKGDIIVAVDGKPAASYGLAQLRALLSSAPGTIVHLRIRSGSTERDVILTLRDYV